MKEALVSKGTKVQIVDSPIPTPNENQVPTKAIVSGSNPKDWKIPEILDDATNPGDDIAGVVEKVGANVFEFKPGDRVAAFHEMRTPGGATPKAAAIPLAAMTAAVALYLRLGLPQPWQPATTPTPLIIYGATSAMGIYAIQLAKRSNIHPLLCVAGRACDYVSGLLDSTRGDTVLDYREGDDYVSLGTSMTLSQQGLTVAHVLDAVSEGSSIANIAEILRTPAGRRVQEYPVLKVDAKVTFVLSGEKEGFPEGVEQSITQVADVHNEAKDFGYVYYRYIAKGLQEGWFKPQRVEVVPGGLGGVQTGLQRLKEGKASGVKYVFRIGETEGVER
ncbi:alcohol dehydrogenase-like protein [Chaetomium sp. MPI-CAGE-AT-0009]|nr:alcohol dehydrogenase-like protein [Chaetomium sp. MPI-CAGE-AT-0009]